MEATAKEATTFNGRKEVVVVKPIMRSRNPLISDPEHEAFFLVGTSTVSYSLPVDRQNNLVNPFSSKAEQDWLEKELDLDLNVHKRKDNYWHKFRVRLGKDNRRLDLNNPKDYIEWLVLRANNLYIAPTGESMGDRATYRYALVSEEFETKKSVKRADLEIDAYMHLGKLKDDKEAMLNFLKVYGKKVSPQSKENFLFTELRKLIDTDIDGFLNVAKDKENYDLRLLIANAVEVGAVLKDGRKYSLPGGDDLCAKGEVPTLLNVVNYLKHPGNQDILTALKARVENAKD